MTTNSRTISRIAGPVLVAIGVGVLVNHAAYRDTAMQFLISPALIYFSGILAMIGGLAIIHAHPQFTRDWRSAITGLGWFLLAVGVLRVVAPQLVAYMGIVSHPMVLIGFGVVFVAFGAFLTVKGYLE